MKLHIVLALVWTFVPVICLGQKAWTLEDCVETALDNNLEIRSRLIQAQQSRAEADRTVFELAPTVGASAAGSRTFRKDEEPVTRLGLNLDASLSINLGLSHYHRIRSAKAAYLASRYETRAMEKEIEADVTEAFLSAVIAVEALDFAEQNLETICLQLENARLFVDYGRRSAGALAEIEAEAAAGEAAVAEADALVASRILKLTSIMDIPYDRDIILVPPEFDAGRIPEPPEADQPLIDGLSSLHPTTKAMSQHEESAKHSLKASVGNLFPSLTFGAGYGSSWTDISDVKWKEQIKDNPSGSLSLTLSIPLFSAFQTHSAIKSGKLAVEGASIATQAARKQVSTEVRNLLVEAANCRKKFISTEKSCNAFEILAAESERKFAEGSLTAMEYTVILAKYRQAHSSFIQAKWQYCLLLKTIEIYLNE